MKITPTDVRAKFPLARQRSSLSTPSRIVHGGVTAKRGNRQVVRGVSWKDNTFRMLMATSWLRIVGLLLMVLVFVAISGALLLLPLSDQVAGMEGASTPTLLRLFLLVLSNVLTLGCEFGAPRTAAAQIVVLLANLVGVLLVALLLGVVVTKFSSRPHVLVFSDDLLVGRHRNGKACFRCRVCNSAGHAVVQPTLRMIAVMMSPENAAARAADPDAFLSPSDIVELRPEAPWHAFAQIPGCIYINHVCDESSPFHLSHNDCAPHELPFTVDGVRVIMMSVVGTDSVLGTTVFGVKYYRREDVKTGFKFVDCMDSSGNIDMELFNTLLPTRSLHAEDGASPTSTGPSASPATACNSHSNNHSDCHSGSKDNSDHHANEVDTSVHHSQHDLSASIPCSGPSQQPSSL